MRSAASLSLVLFMPVLFFSCIGADVKPDSSNERFLPMPSSGFSGLAQQAENRKAELMRAFAQSLREDAYGRQLRGRSGEAVIQYRKSLAYWPDPELEKYIQQIERKPGALSRANCTMTATDQSEKALTVNATVRNHSRRGLHIFVQGESPDGRNFYRPGEIRTITVQVPTNGQVIFLAGTPGNIIDSEKWCRDPHYPERMPSIFLDELLEKKLQVMTGLK